MELIFRPAFNRDFKNIRNKKVLQQLATIFKQVEKAKEIDEI